MFPHGMGMMQPPFAGVAGAMHPGLGANPIPTPTTSSSVDPQSYTAIPTANTVTGGSSASGVATTGRSFMSGAKPQSAISCVYWCYGYCLTGGTLGLATMTLKLTESGHISCGPQRYAARVKSYDALRQIGYLDAHLIAERFQSGADVALSSADVQRLQLTPGSVVSFVLVVNNGPEKKPQVQAEQVEKLDPFQFVPGLPKVFPADESAPAEEDTNLASLLAGAAGDLAEDVNVVEEDDTPADEVEQDPADRSASAGDGEDLAPMLPLPKLPKRKKKPEQNELDKQIARDLENLEELVENDMFVATPLIPIERLEDLKRQERRSASRERRAKNKNRHKKPKPTEAINFNMSPLPQKPPPGAKHAPEQDPHLWLEEVDTATVLDWARAENAKTLGRCVAGEGRTTVPRIEETEEYKQSLAILDSKDKIAHVRKIGPDTYYNFWRDEKHVRGIWRRTSFKEYSKANPEEVQWEVVLDLDELGKKEGKSWVWGGYSLLPELGTMKGTTAGGDTIVLLKLSPGGSDAVVVREFSLTKKEFVDASKAFTVEEGKTRISYVDVDNTFVGAKLANSEKDGLTDSGYPRLVKQWNRSDKSLEEATTVFEGRQTDVACGAYSCIHTTEKSTLIVDCVVQSKSFYTRDHFVRNQYFEKANAASDTLKSIRSESAAQKLFFGSVGGEKLIRLTGIPDSADMGFYGDWITIQLRKQWGSSPESSQAAGDRDDVCFSPGCFLVAPLLEVVALAGEVLPTEKADSLPAVESDETKQKFFGGDREEVGKKIRALCTPLFTGTKTAALQDTCDLKNFLLIHYTDNLKPQLKFWKLEEDGNKTWVEVAAPAWTAEGGSGSGGTDPFASISLRAVDWDGSSNELWFTKESYTTPESLFRVDTETDLIPKGMPSKQAGVDVLKSAPKFFDDANVGGTLQRFATSADGTQIPYFLVGKDLDKTAAAPRPTVLYGYGGFEISLTPSYMAIAGRQWIEKGGIFALANIRGGGEFGPEWHQAALKKNRLKAYEDFEACGKDLVDAGLTKDEMLGCMGGSNGGLLTGNMFVRALPTTDPEKKIRPAWGAIVSQCPLLDMYRFHKLLAGASWMAEYGDPDTEWDFIQTYSPYHMLPQPCAGEAEAKALAAAAPSILFTCSTKDDRVHPAHARKMVKRIQEVFDVAGGGENAERQDDVVRYYENIEGGHSGAADNKQRAFMKTLEWLFMWEKLSGGGVAKL
eukprot:g5036.t1